MRLRVAAIRELTARIKAFDLVAAGGEPLPPQPPGAHIRLAIPTPSGIEERAYSLYGDPADAGVYRIAVLRQDDGRGGSLALHALEVGTELDASGPIDAFPLTSGVLDTVLIAGGIGITPILSQARALAAKGAVFHLHYCGRTFADLALLDEVAAVAGSRLSIYCDGGNPDRGIPLDAVLAPPAAGRHVYVCGPGPLIDGVVSRAQAFRWPATSVHFERFAATTAPGDTPFTAVLVRSGVTLEVGAGETLLDRVLAAGIEPAYDCKAGSCGMCVTRVISTDGPLVHRDSFLSPQQKDGDDQLCLCVSRTSGERLELDL